MACRQCGFRHLWPIPEPERLDEFYAKQYVDPLVKTNLGRKIRLLASACVTQGTLLDVGAGNGDASAAFAQAGFQVTSLEPGQQAVAHLRQQGFETLQAALPAHNSGGSKHDVAHLSYVLEHVPNPAEVLNNLRESWVTAAGWLILDVPNDFNAWQQRAAKAVGPWWVVAPDHINYFTKDSLANLLNRCGWTPTAWTSDFPMEMFLLMGEHYVGAPEVGKACHQRRLNFEAAFADAPEALDTFYEALADQGLGRSITVLARAGSSV